MLTPISQSYFREDGHISNILYILQKRLLHTHSQKN